MDYDSLLMCLMYSDDLLMTTLISTFDEYIKHIKSAPSFPVQHQTTSKAVDVF